MTSDRINHLSPAWTATRLTLQAYAQALTAFPRAAGNADTRWNHVAMDPTPEGFGAAPVELADGSYLESRIDLVSHLVVASAGDDRVVFEMEAVPSPSTIGSSLRELAAAHGTQIEVDEGRLNDEALVAYDPSQAELFHASAKVVVSAMEQLNSGLAGETTGPHLWPHGFDIATEWYSTRLAPEGGNAQIAAGWFPSEDSYLYVNPWPYEDAWARAELPHGATWHLEGWQGAELAVPPNGFSGAVMSDLARAVHDLSGPSLAGDRG